MNDVLSLWRSPLDKVALREAEALSDRQPRCTITFDEDLSQLTIYNFAYYLDHPPSTPANTALDNMLAAMNPSYYGQIGGLAFIPQNGYSVSADNPSSTVHLVREQCNIIAAGTGGYAASGSSFYHFAITPIGGASGSTFLTTTGTHSNGGVYFRGLAFEWASAGTAADICISAGTLNCRAIRCTFTNCPTAFDAVGEASGLDACTINYQSGPDNAVAVMLQGPQAYAVGPCEYSQLKISGGGPSNCTAIALGGGAGKGNLVHGVVTNIHLSDWSYAINYNINPGVNDSHLTAVHAQSYVTCVNMQPPAVSPPDLIFGEKYTSCTFKKSGDSTVSAPIVFIDTNGQSNNSINDIEFLNCTVFSQAAIALSGLYCYKITSGNNIRIIGGTASNAGPGTSTAGIAIAPTNAILGPAGPGRVTILGVDLSATYPNAGGGGAQLYALLVSASLQGVVTVEDCQMAGYGSGNPVNVTGPVNGNLFIRDCAGYNDQNTTIASGTASGHFPTTDTSASTAGGLTGGTNYYGPSLVIFTNSGSSFTFTINGLTPGWTVPANAFVTYYIASPYDTIKFPSGHSLTGFMWIGK